MDERFVACGWQIEKELEALDDAFLYEKWRIQFDLMNTDKE